MFDSLFEDAVSIIKKWKPKQNYSDENQYRNDLMDFLRKEFNENKSPLQFGPQKRVSITKEDGRGLCDIGIDRKIGIELKKDLKGKSQIDRLAGQIIGYKKDYQDIFVVLVGNTDSEARELLKDKISDLSSANVGFGLNQEPRIKIIDKSFSSSEKEEKPRGPFDFGF